MLQPTMNPIFLKPDQGENFSIIGGSVRLLADSAATGGQCTIFEAPIPAGDGCGEVDWWLNPDSAKDRSKAGESYGKRVGAQPKLPESCDKLVNAASR